MLQNLYSVRIQTVPLKCTHRQLSFEWSHLRVSFDSAGVAWKGHEGIKTRGLTITPTEDAVENTYRLAKQFSSSG